MKTKWNWCAIFLAISIAFSACAIPVSYSVGKDDGYTSGYSAGKSNGYKSGKTAGYKIGIADSEAYQTGYDAGYKYGHKDGVNETSTATTSNSYSSDSSDSNSVTVYVTNTGSKYHKSWCSYLRQSKIAMSLSDAKAYGYTPCSRCY